MEEIKLNDIADDLIIINKATIDSLYRLENCADCIALYIFYYKTAKWQKSSVIKATDDYIKKSLKWGADKIRKTKATLKEKGLINVISTKDDKGKVLGWYIEVAYLINANKIQTHNTQNPQHPKATSGLQTTNSLININKVLNENKLKDIDAPIKKHKYGAYNNVLLTEEEHAKLCAMANGSDAIEYLSEYMAYKEYKAKSHYLAIKKWVFDALKEDQMRKEKLNRFTESDRPFNQAEADRTTIPDEELGNVKMFDEPVKKTRFTMYDKPFNKEEAEQSLIKIEDIDNTDI